MAERKPAATLDEMRALLAEMPGPDAEARAAAARRIAELALAPGALGRLDEIVEWMAAWQGRHPPSADHPRAAVFAGAHGIAAAQAAATAGIVAKIGAGGGAVNQLCRIADADLRVYELALDHPTADFTQGPAMSDEDCATAMAYGMMAVEPGIDLLAVGTIGGADASAAALACALWGGEAADWVDLGSGLDGLAYADGIAAARAGIALHRPESRDPFDWLRRLGGREAAALAGAVIAARLARVPVLLDGHAATVAASVLQAASPHALDHCLVAHLSPEPGHRRLLEILGKTPLLDLGIGLGGGVGATLAIATVKAAIACHAGMANAAAAGAREA